MCFCFTWLVEFYIKGYIQLQLSHIISKQTTKKTLCDFLFVFAGFLDETLDEKNIQCLYRRPQPQPQPSPALPYLCTIRSCARSRMRSGRPRLSCARDVSPMPEWWCTP